MNRGQTGAALFYCFSPATRWRAGHPDPQRVREPQEASDLARPLMRTSMLRAGPARAPGVLILCSVFWLLVLGCKTEKDESKSTTASTGAAWVKNWTRTNPTWRG